MHQHQTGEQRPNNGRRWMPKPKWGCFSCSGWAQMLLLLFLLVLGLLGKGPREQSHSSENATSSLTHSQQQSIYQHRAGRRQDGRAVNTTTTTTDTANTNTRAGGAARGPRGPPAAGPGRGGAALPAVRPLGRGPAPPTSNDKRSSTPKKGWRRPAQGASAAPATAPCSCCCACPSFAFAERRRQLAPRHPHSPILAISSIIIRIPLLGAASFAAAAAAAAKPGRPCASSHWTWQ